ncbi:terminase small subunit [Streptomyces phage JPandJE]|nr:terminase small subunit [Streptomyces phage JPandJE]
MRDFNPDDLRTVGDIGKELGYSNPKIQRIVADLTPVLAIGNGRIAFYDKRDIIEVLFEENKRLLDFMGYLSPKQSYDIVTKSDAPASE